MPHLDYADVIYDQPHNSSFCKNIESVQCNNAESAIRYQELGIGSLGNRRW